MNIKAFWRKYWINITLIFIIIASFILRIWHLGKIGDQIFDEVYFVKFAENYINGVSFFDIHPPLGKLIISSVLYFHDTSFTWRLMPAIFGTLLIILGYFTGKELSSKITGLFAAGILALDGLVLVYSRTGLIDIFLTFFILLSFYLFLKYVNSQKILFLILAGIAVGLASSVKYIGALILIVFFVMALNKKISLKKNFWKFFIFLSIVPLTIYLAFFLFNWHGNDFFSQVLEWHKQSFDYNLGLKDTHPYGSKWWTWFLLLRPIWLYFKDTNGQYIGVDGLGNPLSWWSSLVIIPLLIWGTAQKYKNHLIILTGFLVFLLFWAPVKRVLFFYHAIPSFVFLTLGLSLWLERLLKYPYGKYLVILFFLILTLLFIYFLPIWIGIPLNSNQFYQRMWLKGWI